MATHASLISAGERRGDPIVAEGSASGWSRLAGRYRRNRSERASAAALVVGLHAVAIALVMVSRPGQTSFVKPGLVAFDIVNSGKQEPHRQIARPQRLPVIQPKAAASPVQAARIDVPQRPFPAEIGSNAEALVVPAAFGGSCDLTEPVQEALRQSDDVRRQLPAIPRNLRSVANAIVVWNAGWTEPAVGPAQAAFAAVRQTIVQTVAASPAECRNQLQRGPRLLFVPGAAGAIPAAPAAMTVLALGSGQWTWQQLIDGGQPLPAGVLAAADPPPAPFGAPLPTAAASGASPAMSAMLAALVHRQSPTSLPFYP